MAFSAGPAGSCMINWTMLWHSRPEAVCAVDRDLIWQIYRRPNQGCGASSCSTPLGSTVCARMLLHNKIILLCIHHQ